MPGKKDKLTELPKLDEWKAPWEVDDEGKDIPADDQEIKPDRLKKYLHNLLGDKLKLQTQVEETTVRAEELEQKVANAADPAKLTELQQEVTRTRQERDEARQRAEKDAQSTSQALKWEIALDKGLTKRQAKFLVGATREELEEAAEELLQEFGGKGKGGDDGEEGTDPRRGPRRTLNNGGEPGSVRVEDEIDPDKWAAEVYAKNRGR